MKLKKRIIIDKDYFIIIPFILPLLYLFAKCTLDNDFWFTINQGRYVLNNGFPNMVIGTIHSGLSFIYQSYGTGIIYYLIYNYLGGIGILLFITLIVELIIFIFYKLCLLVSKNNNISTFITIIFALLLYPFMTIRPQLFTMLNLVSIIYCLELYINKKKTKYLIPIPFLGLLEANMHAIYFIPIMIIITPFLINSFKFNIKNIKSEGYNKKPLFITYIITIIMGFINPYTYKILTYGFKSYGNSFMSSKIEELNALNFHNTLGKICILVIIITYILYFRNKDKKIPIRYYLLLFGTSILAFDAYKSFYLFTICSFYPIASLYKKNKELPIRKNVLITTIIFIITTTILVFSIIKINKPINYEVANYLDQYNEINNPKLYTSFYDGSYFEYRGYNCYIDPRAEVFLKVNNKKEDILYEYFNLQKGIININMFLDKYNFDYLIIHNEEDILYYYLLNNKNELYIKIYDDNNYQIWKLNK